jgi:hypothetical protein
MDKYPVQIGDFLGESLKGFKPYATKCGHTQLHTVTTFLFFLMDAEKQIDNL